MATFQVMGPRLWNSLYSRVHIGLVQSINSFKKELKRKTNNTTMLNRPYTKHLVVTFCWNIHVGSINYYLCLLSLTHFFILYYLIFCGSWWYISRFGAFRTKGRRFESRSSCHEGTLSKTFTRSGLWRFIVNLRHSIRAVSGAPLSSMPSGLDEAL